MKKFIFQSIIFIILLFLIDTFFGIIISHLRKSAKDGDTHRFEYIADFMTDSVIIMGSSRAIHHYSTPMLTDSLGISCYNCGLDGNGIIYNYGILRMITERYKPALIIYDVIPNFDIIELESSPNQKYLGALRPYYTRDGIAEIFAAVDPTEKFKMLSNLYAYNTRFIQILSDNVHAQNSNSLGYKPLEGTMDYEPPREDDLSKYKVDDLKISYLNECIHLCKEKNIKLVFAISPFFFSPDKSVYQPIYELAEVNDIPIWDFSTIYVGNRDYFKDSSHLNSKGATDFTNTILPRIRKVLSGDLEL